MTPTHTTNVPLTITLTLVIDNDQTPGRRKEILEAIENHLDEYIGDILADHDDSSFWFTDITVKETAQ